MTSHGISGYQCGCRCEVCRVAKSENSRRWRARSDRVSSPEVDEVAVARACKGDRRVFLNRAETSLAFEYLDGHGYSARRIADRLGVSTRTVYRWRQGRRPNSRLPRVSEVA